MVTSVARNLRDLRQQKGMTQGQLAEAAETTDATISRIERGRFSPSQDLLGRFADALGVDPADLVARERKDKKPTLRPAEARLLALIRNLNEAAIDDVVRALKLMLAVGRNATPVRKPTARRG